jgi:hypothetical protein
MTDTLDRAAVDIAQATRFFDMLAEGEPVTFQTFDDSQRKRRELAQHIHGSIEACASALQAMNRRGAGIFWMVNYGDGQGRKTENITGIRALFLDLDGAPLQPALAAGAEPHAVIESSPGKWHVYWLVTGCSLHQFTPAQRALAAKFNGDKSVHDLPRVLRVPGFLHSKGEPFRTRIVSLEPLQPYPFDDLVQRLGLDLSAPALAAPRVDASTGEIISKIAAGGRHAHLCRKLSDLNWRGIPEAGIRAALHQINDADCDPPKAAAEVDALVTDWLKRYARQHGADLPLQPEASVPPDPLDALGRWLVTDEQVLTMKQTRIIFRDLIAMSHLAVWSAPANAGKTQMAKFAASELARDFTVLFFQEDASAGDLPALHEHAKTHGYKLLNSTLAGSSPDEQIQALRRLAREAADLSRYVFFFDTLKKFADLMSKGGTRGFFQLMRALTQRGATVILLGHTNKHKGTDGKLIFEGVGDVRNDVDELIYLESTPKADDGTVTMTMKPDKVRCVIKEATFVLDTNTMTVRPADRVVDVGAILAAQRQRQADEPLIACIRSTLASGGMGFDALKKAVMAESGQGRNTVSEVIDRYCGTETSDMNALWLETRMRLNNTRHISLKPGRAA